MNKHNQQLLCFCTIPISIFAFFAYIYLQVDKCSFYAYKVVFSPYYNNLSSDKL